VAEVLLAHNKEIPETLSARRGEPVDPAIENLVKKALQKDIEDRHKDMSAFLFELLTTMDMLGLKRRRRGAAGQKMARRRDLARATLDAFRLPIATIDATGTIRLANPAFTRFVMGKGADCEGLSISETPLARAWDTMEADLLSACSGKSKGRTVEITSGGEVHRLQMWLEPTGIAGLACLSVLPDLQK
jgi:PAS domain-containing protein